jgi:predicted MFS family arabinose efflux permease
LGTFICGFAYAMLGFDYSILTLVDIHEPSLRRRNLGFAVYVNHHSITLRKKQQRSYMGLNGISFSIAFIVTPTLGTFIAERFGFTILWIGTGVLATIIAIAFYYIVPWMIGDRKHAESKYFGRVPHSELNLIGF